MTDGPNPWYFRISGGSCTQVSGTELNGISGYTSNTYNVVAYSDSGCGKQIASDSVTIPIASFDATRDGWDVDLELTDGPNPWYYKFNGGSCTQVSGSEVNGISGNTPGTYNVVAYSDSGCGKQIASDSVAIPTASLSATVDDDWQYTATLTDGPNNWWLTLDGAGCVSATGSSFSSKAAKSGSRSVAAYSDSACSSQIASATFTIADASLSATVASDQSVDLALSNGPTSWWYKDASDSCTSVSGTAANDLTGYAVGSHTATAYVDNNCRQDIAEASFTIATTHTLNVGFANGNAYLQLNPTHNTDWWYRADNGSCTQVYKRNTTQAALTGLTPGSSHTATAYRDSGCVTAMTPTTSFTVPSLSATVGSDQSVDLALSDYPGGSSWWYKDASGTCTAASGTTVDDLTGYAVGTHTITAYGQNNCTSSYWIASASFTIAHTHTLGVSIVNGDLYLRPKPAHKVDWWYQVDDGSCAKADSRNYGPITGMTAGSSHTATAYRDSGCVTAMAPTNSFTVPSLSATVDTDKSVDLALSDYPDSNWWYKNASGVCTAASGTTVSDLTGYAAGTHTVKAYSDSNCTYWVATATFTVPPPTLTATVDSSYTTVDLAMAYGPHYWWYKIDASGSCTQVSGTTVSGLSGQSAGTHTVTAYSDRACDTQIASTTFAMPSLSATVDDDWELIATLSDGPSKWWLTENDGTCLSAGGSSYDLQLHDSGTYRYQAYSDSNCSTKIANEATVTIATVSLTATVASDQSVDLALSDGPTSWWYKNASDSCTSASGTAANDLTGYAVGSHTVTAYSDSYCRYDIAEASFTIAHTHTLDVSINGGTIYLRLVHTGDWWYQVDDGSCTKASSRNEGPISGLSAGSHTATAYRDSGCVTAMAASNFTIS